MGVPLKEVMLTLVILGLTATTTYSSPTSTDVVSKEKVDQSADYQYEDYIYDDEQDKVLFSEDKPCPRDCICKASINARIARCSRLEVGTQKFGDDITGIVVENVDKKHPLVLTDMMFRKLGLHQITSVQIINSIIASISPTAFKGLHELYSVNLTGNGIEKIDPDLFAYNDKLSLVDLSDNPLNVNPYSNISFINSSSIQELEIARCGIKRISKNTLSKLPNLMYINLSGNKLKELHSSVFANLRGLEEVDLGENYLESLPDELFADNSEMTTLRLRGNPITSVIGVDINELLTIDLSMAKINTIGPSMFSSIPLISNLNLSGNGIRKIHNQAFHDLTMLNYLDLSSNSLDFVSDQLIKNNIQLDIFKISRNPYLKNLPEEGFVCSGKQFNIYLFDASECSLEKISNNTFKTMPALSQLLLSHNNIKSIGSALQKSPRLVEIDLSYNSLTLLDKKTFSMNTDLGKLNLAGNPLTTLSAELFVSNPILTWLDVSSCRLESLWAKQDLPAGSIMNNLHFVNISNNNIKSINLNELQTINKLFTLDISRNPLECTLAFQSLMTWLGEHNVSPAATDLLSSKMELSEKSVDVRHKWSFLAKTVCSPKEVPSSSEESISVEKARVEEMLKKIEENNIDGIKEDYDEDEEDDYDEGTFPDGEPKVSDDLSKILEITHNTKTNKDTINHSEYTDEVIKEIPNIIEDMDVTYSLENRERTYIQYLQPLAIAILIMLIIVFVLVKLIKHSSNLRNDKGFRCAIISITSPNQGRVKKDCGLVYQQLSEDLTGPKTPIISRQLLGSNQPAKVTDISYQSSPFHHSNITPEHV